MSKLTDFYKKKRILADENFWVLGGGATENLFTTMTFPNAFRSTSTTATRVYHNRSDYPMYAERNNNYISQAFTQKVGAVPSAYGLNDMVYWNGAIYGACNGDGKMYRSYNDGFSFTSVYDFLGIMGSIPYYLYADETRLGIALTNGYVATTTDANTWTYTRVTVTTSLTQRITKKDSNYYFALQDKIYTTTDFITNSLASITFPTFINDIDYNPNTGLWAMNGPSGVFYTTTDLTSTNWQRQNLINAPYSMPWKRVGDLYCLCHNTAQEFRYSFNGVDWFPNRFLTITSPGGFRYENGKWFVYGYGIEYSDDGLTWQALSMPRPTGNFYGPMLWLPSSQKWLMMDGSGNSYISASEDLYGPPYFEVSTGWDADTQIVAPFANNQQETIAAPWSQTLTTHVNVKIYPFNMGG